MNIKNTLLILLVIALSACNRPTNFVKVETNYGDIIIELYDETPQHRDNFQKLVKEGFYDDLLFHRVIEEFMIQGGDPESKNAEQNARLGGGGPGYKIPAELDASDRCYHKKGALSAAREGDRSNPDKLSSGSQFYIVVGRPYSTSELSSMEKKKAMQARQTYFNMMSIDYQDTIFALSQSGDIEAVKAIQNKMLAEADQKIEEERNKYYMTDEQKETYSTDGGTPHLDGSYTVFGQVLEGIEVVEKISMAKTNGQDRPLKDIAMKMKFVKKP